MAACGLWPIADNRPETKPVMMLPRVAGAAGVTTAAVLAWKLAVETTGVAAAITVGDALLVGKLAAATSCGRDAAASAGALVLATLTETFEVVAPIVGERAAEDPRRGVDTEMFDLLLLASGVDFFACAGDDAEVCPGVDAVVDGPDAAVVVAVLVEVLGSDVAVVGSVLVVPVSVTEVLAPPEACTTPACGSVDEPGGVEEFVDASVDDDTVPVLVGPVLGDDEADDADVTVEFAEESDDGEPADVEPLDEELLEEPVDEEPLGSASAIAGLLASTTPNPSVTANAPTRPT